MTSYKAKVKERHPGAVCYRVCLYADSAPSFVVDAPIGKPMYLGVGPTPREAWRNAWEAEDE